MKVNLDVNLILHLLVTLVIVAQPLELSLDELVILGIGLVGQRRNIEAAQDISGSYATSSILQTRVEIVSCVLDDRQNELVRASIVGGVALVLARNHQFACRRRCSEH